MNRTQSFMPLEWNDIKFMDDPNEIAKNMIGIPVFENDEQMGEVVSAEYIPEKKGITYIYDSSQPTVTEEE